MLGTALHRRVALAVALTALALSGAVASAPVSATDASAAGTNGPTTGTDTSTAETDGPTAEIDPSAASSDVNVSIDHDGPLVLRAAPNQSVRVRSDAPAGTDVTVTIRSTRYNVLRSSEVTVSNDGTGTATFDLSGVETGASFTVTSRDAETEVEGVVVNESATIHRDATFIVSEPATNYTIRGQVLDSAVSKLDVRYSPEGGTHSAPRTVSVGEDGSFAATFDLSSLSSETEVSVEVGGLPRSVNAVVVTDESGPTAYAFVETPADATIRYPEEMVLVHAESNQTVRGTTNLRPGTEFVVRAVNDERNSPTAFTRTTNVSVGEDGSFAARLNFTGIEPGTNFSLMIGPGLASTKGRVVNDSVSLPTVTTTTARPTTVNESGFPFTTSTTTPDDSPGGHADEFGIPGFGFPAALVALLAGLALARRE